MDRTRLTDPLALLFFAPCHRMMVHPGGMTVIAILAAALAAPVAAPAAPAAPMTIQQQFDKASTDFDAGNCTAAASGFAAIAERLPATSNSRPLIQLRQ